MVPSPFLGDRIVGVGVSSVIVIVIVERGSVEFLLLGVGGGVGTGIGGRRVDEYIRQKLLIIFSSGGLHRIRNNLVAIDIVVFHQNGLDLADPIRG